MNTAASDGTVIRTQGLSKTYPTGVVAVDGLDLEVRPARSSACSARTAPARRRPSGCSRRA